MSGHHIALTLLPPTITLNLWMFTHLSIIIRRENKKQRDARQ